MIDQTIVVADDDPFYANPGSVEAGALLSFADRERVVEHLNLITRWDEFERFFSEVVRTCFGFRLPFFGPFQIADLAELDVYGMSLTSVGSIWD